jgi:hypothetical protein
MEQHLCTLDICGHEVEVFLTDDPEVLGEHTELAADGVEVVVEPFEKYDVGVCKIWLYVDTAPSMLRSRLFHGIYEFVLGYFNLIYNPEDGHECFLQFSNILWCVLKANRDILFGDRIRLILRDKSQKLDEVERLRIEHRQLQAQLEYLQV